MLWSFLSLPKALGPTFAMSLPCGGEMEHSQQAGEGLGRLWGIARPLCFCASDCPHVFSVCSVTVTRRFCCFPCAQARMLTRVLLPLLRGPLLN